MTILGSGGVQTYYTIKEAAELLRCSKKHIMKLIKDNKLQVVDIGLGKRKQLRIKTINFS